MKEIQQQKHASLGDILVRVGIITPDQLKAALSQCDPEQRSLGPVLVALGFTTEDKISKAVSISLNIPFFTTFEGLLDSQTAALLPEAMARKLLVVPILQTGDKLMLGMVNPADMTAIDQVTVNTGMLVQPVMTTLSNMFSAIQEQYGRERIQLLPQAQPEKTPGAPTAAKASQPAVASAAVARVAQASVAGDSVADLVNALLHEGMDQKASDIHLESGDKQMQARFRVDGMLRDGKTFHKDVEAAIVARIKLLARLDITETRLPQDGHIRFVHERRNIDVRVSTLPTVHGEKIVMRLLDSSKSLRKLNELGIAKPILDNFTEAIASPNGLILVTGPTGSGKTTTLYAALAALNKTDRNIVTLEDPVEYVIPRINQMEAFPKIGLDFAAGLRAILRQDPNVILVGEIRDLETAEIAMQASITGHLVFSTLHTNDAVSSVHRLLNMRVEPFMIAAALRGVLAQRLVRRLCDKCKRRQTLSDAALKQLGLSGEVFEAVGCPACDGSGYLGRFPIHEWLSVSKKVRELVIGKGSVDALRAAAEAEGFKSMRKAIMEKVALGETSVEEAMRITSEQADS